MPEAPTPQELTSWKEIAHYLGVTVRTAQLWETTRNLPVRRLPGSGRSRVCSTIEGLEAWKNGGKLTADAPAQPTRRRVRWRWVASGVLVLASLLLLSLSLAPHPVPESWRLAGSQILILDRDGREIWSRELGQEATRKLYLENRPADHGRVWIGDLNRDGRREVLLSVHTGRYEAGPLLCIDDRGEELWRFEPGRSVATEDERFEPPFRVTNFTVVPIGGKRETGILVLSSHHTFFPAQAALLSPEGELWGEYWHAGHLHVVEAADKDGDGQAEIYLGGMNNARRCAEMIVLTPEGMRGAGWEQSSRYRILGMERAEERARVFFKPSLVSNAVQLYNQVQLIHLLRPEIQVDTLESFQGATMLYEFEPDLRVLRVSPSDHYLQTHRELERQKKLSQPYSNREVEELASALRVEPVKPSSPAGVR